MVDSGGKPWLLDKIYVIKSGSVFRAQPPTKVVNNGQTVTWDGRGGTLAFTDPPPAQLTNVKQPAKDIITATVASTDPFFEYSMTCNGFPVEGNSPPIIIVE